MLLARSRHAVLGPIFLVTACGAPPSDDEASGPAVEGDRRAQPAQSTGDRRFGFIGDGARSFARTFNTGSYVLIGNQNDPARPRVIQALEPASDPLPGERVVVRLGLYNARRDGFGQTLKEFSDSVKRFGEKRGDCYAKPWCFFKPRYTWFQPDVSSVPSIEEPQIVEAVRRWKSKGLRPFDIVFEIGNEPNYFVSMTPGEYAFLYRQYHRAIKRLDPEFRVALGALFAFELMPEDARQHVAQLIAWRGEQETAARLNQDLAGFYEARTFMFSLGTSALIGLGLDLWGSYAGERATRDVKNLLFSRFFGRTTTQYVAEVLDALPEDIAPDIISFHAYPADFKNRLTSQEISAITDRLARDLADIGAQKRPFAYPGFCSGDVCFKGAPSIWLTEIGNINPYVEGKAYVYRLSETVRHLSENGAIAQWFWYKPVGRDAQFELMKDATGVAPPFTALTWDETYGTPTNPLPAFPAKVPCGQLNFAGQLYYQMANYERECSN